MDEESVESFKPMATPEGVAGIWLRNNMPEAGRREQISLGAIIEAMLAEGIRKGKNHAISTMELSPTVGAAKASLEADIIQLERAINKKRDEGIDFDVFTI